MLDGSCDHDKLARLHIGANGNGELGKPGEAVCLFHL
jgi:hypothetical protein